MKRRIIQTYKLHITAEDHNHHTSNEGSTTGKRCIHDSRYGNKCTLDHTTGGRTRLPSTVPVIAPPDQRGMKGYEA